MCTHNKCAKVNIIDEIRLKYKIEKHLESAASKQLISNHIVISNKFSNPSTQLDTLSPIYLFMCCILFLVGFFVVSFCIL